MEPKCDYVLVFDTSVAKSTENPPMPNEYLQLVDALKNAGLHVTARQGAPGSETILVLLRATTARLLKELELQARLDFTKGVHTPRANMLLESAAQREVPLTPAERLALVNQIISTSQERSTADVKYAGVSPGGGLPSLAATWKQLTSKYATESPFGRVKGIFPPHDEEWNKKWLSSWSKELFILKENPEQLDQVAA